MEFTIKYADPDTFEPKTKTVASIEEAKAFLAENWRIGLATVVPTN